MPFHLQNWTKLYFFSVIKKYWQWTSTSGRGMQVSSLHFPCLCYSARERILKDTISPQQKEHKGSQQLRGIFSIFQKSGSWGWGEHTQELRWWSPTCCPADAQDPRSFRPRVVSGKERGQDWELGLDGGLIKDQFYRTNESFTFFPYRSVSLSHTHTHAYTRVCARTHTDALTYIQSHSLCGEEEYCS